VLVCGRRLCWYVEGDCAGMLNTFPKILKVTKKNLCLYRTRHELGTFQVHVPYSPHF
jgi:hypothetical protein